MDMNDAGEKFFTINQHPPLEFGTIALEILGVEADLDSGHTAILAEYLGFSILRKALGA